MDTLANVIIPPVATPIGGCSGRKMPDTLAQRCFPSVPREWRYV
jgi:hypothetical protein